MIITALMTKNGSPYTSYTPTISIWNAISGTRLINEASMYQIGTSSFFGYNFTSFSYNIGYVYTITGDPTNDPSERYQYGSVEQDIPDRITGLIVADAGNTASSFLVDRTESADDYWKDALLLILSGSLVNQVKKINAYNGTTKRITLSSPLTGVPSGGDSYLIINT